MTRTQNVQRVDLFDAGMGNRNDSLFVDFRGEDLDRYLEQVELFSERVVPLVEEG